MTDRVQDPCSLCGIAYRGHFQRWHEDHGWHVWQQETREQTAARLRRFLAKYAPDGVLDPNAGEGP